MFFILLHPAIELEPPPHAYVLSSTIPTSTIAVDQIFSSSKQSKTIVIMKSVAAILTLLVGSSSAFAPVATNSRSNSALAATAFSDRPGVIVPTGYFDPLNLATSEAKFEKFRAAELKHGRVAMLAVIGYVVPEFYRWGGEINFGLKFADIPNGIAAISAVPALGWLQIITLIGAVETVSQNLSLFLFSVLELRWFDEGFAFLFTYTCCLVYFNSFFVHCVHSNPNVSLK